MKAYEMILEQLGGRRFTAMTGATLMCDGDNKLIAKIKGSKKVNHLEISLNSLDLYDIRFVKLGGPKSGFEVKTDETVSGCYGDMMKGIIEEKTGLYLSL